ncbi:MAG: HDIG domain-containing protein [Deltaproteobacteria bacterium]|nr:HDIG domain-containing protein [Deltaproteobacteria bacterium]
MQHYPDRIPSRAECEELMARYAMLPNIVLHSFQVMRVALALTDNLVDGVSINRDAVIAGALLHDITKTRSLHTKEKHAASGGDLLRELGFGLIARIVEQHVVITDVNLAGPPEEKEIVYYADKRVMHDRIVTLEERVQDLLIRYGKTEAIHNQILQNLQQVIPVERKLNSFMKTDIHDTIQEISGSSPRE